jgi:phosphopantothenoylcysteine decarboxylase/phosphopantothenate--cysteine ligase
MTSQSKASAPIRSLLLGVGGGISAYKSADLLRRLQEHGYDVRVIPTRSSLNFVGKATWEALSGHQVVDDLWNNVHQVPHISLAKSSQAIVIAPATADLIAKIAQGRADDLLTNVVIASSAPKILIPAMHPEMWLNPATVANVEILRSRGIVVMNPESGKLTSGDVGVGRYPETASIVETVNKTLEKTSDLLGKRVLISAGGTREPIDDVRYIGNLSSGKQGIAIAQDAASRGGIVTLIAANIDNAEIPGVEVVDVQTADEMLLAMQDYFASADVVVMAAAVADARPAKVSRGKIPTSEYTSIQLLENPDIIASLALHKSKQVIVGFAAQTSVDGKEIALQKLQAKKLDFIYYNDVSGGEIFGSDETQGTILGADGTVEDFTRGSKMTLAHKLISIAIDKLG